MSGLESEETLPENVVFYESAVRGYHEYMIQWPAPHQGELLECASNPENPWDSYAVAVVRDSKTVGHLPFEICHLVFFFIQEGGNVEFEVTGPRQACSAPCGGMEVPGNLVFYSDSVQLVRNLLTLLQTSKRQPKTSWKI